MRKLMRTQVTLILIVLLTALGLIYNHHSPQLRRVQTFPTVFDCSVPSNRTEEHLSECFQLGAMLERLDHCSSYFHEIMPNIALLPVTQEEWENPLAMAHTLGTEIGILELFLVVNFRPRDLHCIHVDANVPGQVHQVVAQLVGCYNAMFPGSQVFQITHPINVTWGHSSLWEADLLCLKELLARDHSWQTFLNLAPPELPLQSISTIRQVVQAGNNVESVEVPEQNWIRFAHKGVWKIIHRNPDPRAVIVFLLSSENHTIQVTDSWDKSHFIFLFRHFDSFGTIYPQLCLSKN